MIIFPEIDGRTLRKLGSPGENKEKNILMWFSSQQIRFCTDSPADMWRFEGFDCYGKKNDDGVCHAQLQTQQLFFKYHI